jgi:hypothetical protein
MANEIQASTPSNRNSLIRAKYVTWVSGTLEDATKDLLYESVTCTIDQREGYTLLYTLNRVWDIPQCLAQHRVISQGNAECTQIRTNFNPTAEEIQALRRFVSRRLLDTNQ